MPLCTDLCLYSKTVDSVVYSELLNLLLLLHSFIHSQKLFSITTLYVVQQDSYLSM
jgi:hypothetical protein